MDGQATNMVPNGEFFFPLAYLPLFPPRALRLHFTLWRVHTTRTAAAAAAPFSLPSSLPLVL